MTLPRSIKTAAGAALMLVLAACGSSSSKRAEAPPDRQDDICAIFDQRPGWREAMIAASARWGSPVPVQMAIIWKESNFRAAVRPPKRYTLGVIPNGHVSSAYGFAQAIDGTWEWYRRESGNRDASRTEFQDAADFVGWYMHKTRETNGIPMSDAYNQYLAYHEGHAGFRRQSFRSKDWLMVAADRVADRALRYDSQIAGCAG